MPAAPVGDGEEPLLPEVWLAPELLPPLVPDCEPLVCKRKDQRWSAMWFVTCGGKGDETSETESKKEEERNKERQQRKCKTVRSSSRTTTFTVEGVVLAFAEMGEEEEEVAPELLGLEPAELTEAGTLEPAEEPAEGDPGPEPDADPEPEADDAPDEGAAEEEGTLTVDDAPDALDEPDAEDDTARLPMVDTVVHSDEAGAGCADGVTGSPWWNVEVP